MQTNQRHLDFYREKATEYKGLLDKFRSETDKDMVSIYEEYLKKIAELGARKK